MSMWFLALIQFLVTSYFQTVPEMTAQNLSSSMVLVDVRSPEEYAVSHIEGAINLQRVEDIVSLIRKNPDQDFVVYCSVGVRSGIVARDVRTQLTRIQSSPGEFSNKVYNLQGGVFRWAIEGRALINQQGTTRLVHGFGWPWKYLLPASLRI